MQNFQLALCAVENGLSECDGEADRRYSEPESRRRNCSRRGGTCSCPAAVFRRKPFVSPRFIIVSVRGLDRQLHCGNAGVESLRSRRTGQKNVFEGRRLEDPVIGAVNIDADGREVARDGDARAHRILVHQQLVVVPAEARIDRPVAEADSILNIGRLFEIRTAAGKGKGCRAGVQDSQVDGALRV